MKSKVGNFIFLGLGFFSVVLGITIVSEGGEGGGVGFVQILMGLFLMSFPLVSIIEHKKEIFEQNKVLDTVKSIVEKDTFDSIKSMDFKILEILPDINELGQKQQWGKIKTAFSNEEKFAFVFEEGIYFLFGESKKFARKDKITIDVSNFVVSPLIRADKKIDKPDGLYVSIRVEGDKDSIDIPRYLYDKAINILFKWYEDFKRNEETIEKYNEFINRIKKLKDNHILLAYPYDLEKVSYGEFLTSFDSITSLIIVGKNLESNAFIMEYRYNLSETPLLVEIPYEEIANIIVEGSIERYSNFLDGHYEEGKWDGKRLAAGYMVAGPVGAALMGKSKSKIKYVEPKNIVSVENDIRKIGIVLNKKNSYIPNVMLPNGKIKGAFEGFRMNGYNNDIEFANNIIFFPYRIFNDFFELIYPQKFNNSKKLDSVNYENYEEI